MRVVCPYCKNKWGDRLEKTPECEPNEYICTACDVFVTPVMLSEEERE